MSAQNIAKSFADRRALLSETTASHNLPVAEAAVDRTTRNEAWGFHGGVYNSDHYGEHAMKHAANAYAAAHKYLTSVHKLSPDVARNYLDSKHGRHMADSFLGGYVPGGTTKTKEGGNVIRQNLTKQHFDTALQDLHRGKHQQAFAEIAKHTKAGHFNEHLDKRPGEHLNEAYTPEEADTALAKAKANTPKQHADDLRAKANANLKRDKRIYGGRRDSIAVSHRDHADLHNVADHVEAGDRASAANSASKLDTAVRDEIPAHVALHLGMHLNVKGRPEGVKLGEAATPMAALNAEAERVHARLTGKARRPAAAADHRQNKSGEKVKEGVQESGGEYHVAAHPYIGKQMHFHDGTNWTPSQTKAKRFASKGDAESFLANMPSTTDSTSGSPPHLWDAHKDLPHDHKPAVHVIPSKYSDSEAYDHTQSTPGIHHGDVLVHGNRVGFMLQAWPVGVVGKHTAWHTLTKHAEGEEPSVDDHDIKQSVAAAKAHAATMGIKEAYDPALVAHIQAQRKADTVPGTFPGTPNHSVFDAYMDSINGRPHVHNGISGTINTRYVPYHTPGGRGEHTGVGSWEISHNADAKGREHPNYLATKEKLGDHWSTQFDHDTAPNFQDAYDHAEANFGKKKYTESVDVPDVDNVPETDHVAHAAHWKARYAKARDEQNRLIGGRGDGNWDATNRKYHKLQADMNNARHFWNHHQTAAGASTKDDDLFHEAKIVTVSKPVREALSSSLLHLHSILRDGTSVMHAGRHARVLGKPDSDPTARVHIVYKDNPDEDTFAPLAHLSMPTGTPYVTQASLAKTLAPKNAKL